MSRLVMKDGKIVMEDDNSQKNAAQKSNSQGSLSMKDGKIVMAQQTPAVNAQKNAQYLARTRAAQNAYLEQDRIPTRPTRDNVMDMAINSLRNRVANSTIGRAANEWASRVSGNIQNVLNESPEVRAAKRQARADNEARRQQWAIDNANIIDQASAQYEGPTRTETVRGKYTDTEGADMFSNDWEPGEEKEIEYTRTVRNENYNPLSREDRDALISRYADAMNGNTDANGYQQVLYEVTKNGGIEQLYREQQADAANDREYGRQLRGVDLDSMNFWQRLGGTLGGTVAGAGEQIASSGVGIAVSGLNREAGIATQEFGPALEQTARRWFYALANGAEDDPAVEEQIRTLASYVGVDADTLVSRVKDRAEQARNSDEDQAVFAYGLLDGLEADQDKIWENAQRAIADAGFYDTINNLQQKSAEHIQYAKDVNLIQNQFGDNLVEAGVSTIQNAADAAMAATLGLSGTGIVAMIPFALRAYGGTYAEQMQQATELGGLIGQDVAKRAAKTAGLSSAIEVGTEMMWGMVGAMSKVTGGGALDDAAQQRLTEILSGWAKTETGRKILTTVGEKALGGITEGLEEVIGDAAEQILKNAGIMPGEAEEWSDWVKNAGHSFVTGALGGLLGEVTSVVSSPLQKSQIGKQLKAGGLDISLNELADLANSEGMENTTLARVYNDTFSGMPRNIESISDLEAGKLYEAYEEMLGKRTEAIDRIEQMQAKVEAGETLTRADVNRITNNSDAVSILAESGAVNEDAFSGGINERRDAVEMALRAFANDSTALSDAQAENVQVETENANTAVSAPNPFLTMSNSAIDNIVRNAQPMSPAQSIRESNTGNVLAGNVLRSAARVVDAAERLNVSERGQDVMARMYSPNMDAIDYVGEMTKYYNQGKEGKTFDVGSIDGVSAIQAQAAFNAGRQEYIERSNNGEEGLRVRTSSERQNGQSAGGSVGVLEESTGAAQGRQTGSFQREGGNARVSAESLRTEGAKAIERSGLRIVTNDSSVAAAKKYAEDRGVNFVAYAGGALNIDGVQSRGYYDSETNTVYVRADHRLFTAEQIAKHETTHAQIHNGKITLGEVDRETVDFATVRDALVNELDQERFDEMVDAYVEMYAGTNLSRQAVFEELICDSVAGMNDFVSVGHLEKAVKFAPSMSKAKAVAEAQEANGTRAGPAETNEKTQRRNIKHPSFTQEEIDRNSISLQKMDPVATLTGNEFAANGRKLVDNVSDFYNSIGNSVYNDLLGEVDLTRASVRTDIAHGTTRNKIISYAAMPSVIRDGVVIHVIDKGNGLERIVVAAPVYIGTEKYYVAAMLNRDPQSQRLYAHDVVAKKEPDSDAAKHLSTNRVGSRQEGLFITDILRNALAVNENIEEAGKEFGDSGEYNSEAAGSFSRELDPDVLEKLNNGKTMKVYRSMQVIKGKLYPPMAAKIDDGSGKRKLVELTAFDEWYRADEHPELLDESGKFKLDKGNGSTLDVAYNPYWHTSNMMLNDQFSSAYKRKNLVTVECEIPVSELTSGYKAQYAKDAVGLTPWHSGPVASQLGNAGNQRNVYLSRWVKVKRIVPDAEVAKSISKTLKGTGITVPVNTVTPSLRAELEKIGVPISEASGLNKKTSAKLNATLKNVEASFDAKTESAAPTGNFSRDTWNESEYVIARNKAAKELAAALGVTQKKAKEYIDNINGIAKMIGDDAARLDYKSSPGRSSFVSNAEYGGSFDFSTLCKKRRLMTGTMTAIQNALPNTVLTPVDFLKIRNMMLNAGLEASCGLCYVEGSRAGMGQFTKEFIRLYKKYYPNQWAPTQAEMSTPDSIEEIRLNHPEVYAEYENFWNNHGKLRESDPNLFASQQKPKLYQLRTAYNGEVLKYFKKDSTIDTKNRNGGVRMQSFSDFEIVHLIDTMQIIMDMSRVGLAGQAYTKVPDFALALGNTGLKINLSLITKGVDANGKLIFDDREGMNHETAFKIRDQYSKNVGTILVTFTDEQLKAAMADDRVDFIIPFHRSQWKKSQYAAMGLPANTKDYTYQQNEKWLDQSKHKHEWRGKMVDTKVKNYMPNEWWQPNLSGKENAEYYLKMCARDGKRPKFYKFLDYYDGQYHLKKDGSTDGYWKLLIDFKMYDNDGNFSPQMPVRPDFNMGEANRMLDSYEGGHEHFPVAQGIVDNFVKEYQESHKGGKLSRDIDSAGNKLSAQQAEYFKDSKVRDENGNLLVMYHGTDADFNVFDFQRGGEHGKAEGFGIYLADDKSVSEHYGGRIIESYANITRPARSDSKTIKSSELAKLIKAACLDEAKRIAEDYGGKVTDALRDTWVSNYVYTYDKSMDAVYREVANNILRLNDNDMDIVQEVMAGMAIRTYDAAMAFYNDILTPTTGIDGFITHWSEQDSENKHLIALAFNSNQVKNTDNQNPTENPDIRFSRDLDADYMKAVESGDTETAAKLVKQAAEAAGYTVEGYHGTGEFGFTKIDTQMSDDGLSFFVTANDKIAGTYSGKTGARRIDEAYDHAFDAEIRAKKTGADNAVSAFEKWLRRTIGEDYADDILSSMREELEYQELDVVEDDWDVDKDLLSDRMDELTENVWGDALDALYDIGKESKQDRLKEELDKIKDAYVEYLYSLGMGKNFENSGNYHLFINPSGLKVVDCAGADWNNIEGETTRSIAKKAFSEGYSGVHFTNIVDMGGEEVLRGSGGDLTYLPYKVASDVYALFNPQAQVKSADPITYDDDGNIIPLSERFNPKNDDIRFSRELKSEATREAGEKLTERQFYSLYSAHKLDMRNQGNIEEQIQKIRSEGFKGTGGFTGNVMPTNLSYKVENGERKPANVSVDRYAPRKGDRIMFVPRSGINSATDSVKLGYRPMFDYEIVTADYDYQPYYEMYNKAYDSTNGTKFSRDLSNTELYEANRQLQKDLTELRSKLKTRTEQYKYWKGQTKVTEGRQLRIEDVTKLAREIIKGQESSADAKAVAEKMKALGEYLLNSQDENVYDEARLKAYEVAHDILANAKTLNTKGGDDFYSDFRTALKNQPIYVAPSVREEVAPDGWNEFRKAQYGTVNMTADQSKGKSVDKVYHDLQATFGEWLLPEYIVSEADQLNKILEVIETYRPVYENLNSYEMADAVEWTANEILTRIIGEEIRETNPTYADRMEKKLAYQKAKAQTAIKQVRQQRDRKVADLKAHYQQVAEDRRNRKIDSEMRSRLLKIAKRLNNKKLDRVTRGLLDQYIGELDLVSKGILGRTVKELETLQAWYDSYRESMGEDFIPDKFIERKIARLSKKHISELTQEEVADLTTVLLNLETMIRTQNQLIESQIKMDAYAAGVQTIDDINNSNGKTGFLNKFISTETATPEREIHRITGYRENSPLYKAAKELSDGQRKMLDYQMRAEALFKKWTTDKKFIRRIAGKNAEEITVSGYVNGKLTDVKITPAMRMALYLHEKNDDNMRHITKGGVKIPDMALYKKGKLQEAYDKATRVVFTRGMLKQIASKMSGDEKAFADAVDRYYNGMSRNEINDTSEALRGYAIAGVEHYYPIDTDGSFLKKEFDAIKRDGSIEGMGILKERIEGATNPIMLYDMNDTLNRSISQHSKYTGLAIPVRNFNKLYGVTTHNYETSVAETLKKNWGSAATSYIEKMMADVQNGTGLKSDAWGDLLARARSKYAGAVLNTNASVAMKQAASYPTAAAVVGYKALRKALTDFRKYGEKTVDMDKLAEYTPLYWYRSKGFSTTELGDIGKEGGHIPKVLNWIQGIDMLTTRKLAKAAMYYVEDNNKNLVKGTDAWWREVANVYNRIIEETQPNYTMMQRPQILRSDNALTRALNMFKTQPFQNFNILYDAFGNLAAKSREYKANATEENLQALKSARTGVARAVGSQAVSAFLFAFMQFAWDAFRGKAKKYKDDDDEMTLASWLKGMGINVLSSVGGMIPFGSYALELGETMTDAILKAFKLDPFFDQTFYGLSENAAESVNDMGNAMINMVTKTAQALSGSEVTESTVRSVVDSMGDIAQFAGIPINNVIKLAQAIGRNYYLATEGRYVGGYHALRLTTDPARYSSDYYDLLWKAYNNDKAAYDEVLQLMLDDGFEEDKIKSAMEKRMKDAQGVSSVKDLESRWMAPSQQKTYDEGLADLEKTTMFQAATDEQQKALLTKLYNLALDNDAGKKLNEKIAGGADVGLEQSEYLLYTLALSMVDEPTESGKYGSYTNDEVEAAILMVPGLSKEERAYLWDAAGKAAKSNPWR